MSIWHEWNRETDEVTPVERPWSDKEFVEKFEERRRVAANWIYEGPFWVSTVFLALDHSFGRGPGVFFESMIFETKHLDIQARYHTGKEAKAGHEKIVHALKFCLRAPRVSRRNMQKVIGELV